MKQRIFFQNFKYIGLIFVFLIFTTIVYFRSLPRVQEPLEILPTPTPTPLEIRSFQDCEAAGYPVMESYPRRCQIPGGPAFVEEIPEESMVACVLDAKICPDGSAVGRVPPECEFAPCSEE